MIGRIRRECLEHVIVLDERQLRRLLGEYLGHYHRRRCHRSLDMDAPEHRPVQEPERGEVVEVAEAGGLYRHYERRAAGAADVWRLVWTRRVPAPSGGRRLVTGVGIFLGLRPRPSACRPPRAASSPSSLAAATRFSGRTGGGVLATSLIHVGSGVSSG